MRQKNPQRLLAAMVIMIVIAGAQVAFLFRYLGRLPGDTVGVTLYLATIILAVIAAGLLYSQWRAANTGTS